VEAGQVGSPVELFEDLGGSAVLLHLEPEAAQLELSLEPQPLVPGLHQTFQGGPVEALQQLHVGAVGHEVQQTVDLLLALVPGHCALDVLQHLPARGQKEQGCFKDICGDGLILPLFGGRVPSS